jgi:excisionase family DNA binding protein
MTTLLTIPKFAAATGLPYRLCLRLVALGRIPSVQVGSRPRIDLRWVHQWLATGGYRAELPDGAPSANCIIGDD